MATHHIEGYTIVTDFWAKPIPHRGMDWTATLDGYDGAPDARGPHSLLGHGSTEQGAILSLLGQLDELEPKDDEDGPDPVDFWTEK